MGQYIVNTKDGEYIIDADRQPTVEEATAAIQQQSVLAATTDRMARGLSASEAPDFATTATDVAFDTIPALMGGVAGFALTRSKVGATIGSSAGGAVGNWFKQKMQMDRGDRKEIKAGEIAQNALYSMPLPGIANVAASASKNIIKSVAIRAGEATGLAATASVVRSEMDDGRLPTFREFTQEVLPATAFGAAFGGVAAKYAKDGALITNQILAQGTQVSAGLGVAALAYNNAVENGDSSPLSKAFMYGSLTYAGTHIPSVLAKMTSSQIKGAVMGPESIVSKADLPSILITSRNQLEAAQNRAASYGNEVNKLLVKHANISAKQRQNLLPGEIEDYKKNLANVLAVTVVNVLEGKAPVRHLPSEFHPWLNKYKRLNAKNGDLLLKLMDHLPEGTQNEIRANSISGTYIRTTYAAHDPRATRGLDYARPDDAKAFKKEIMDGFMNGPEGLPAGIAEKRADAIMARMAGDVAYITSGEAGGAIKVGEKASSLMHTTDITPLGKKFLGEIRDPGVIMKNSLSAQARLITESQRDGAVAKALLDAKLASKAPTGDMIKLMIPADAPIYHRDLAGLYTSDVTAEAYKELSNPHLIGDGVINRTYMALSTLSKASKTVANPLESIITQIYGNVALAASAFRANPIDIIRDFRTTAYSSLNVGAKKLSVGAKIKLFDDIYEAQTLGVLRGGADIQQLKEFASASVTSDSAQAVIDKLSKVYGFPDGIFRYSIYKSNLKELLSFEPIKGMATEVRMKALKVEAARITNDQFPTYDKIARRYRQLSAVGMANVFGAFEYEVIRNSKNQLTYATKLIQDGYMDGNKEMQKAGIKRLIALSAVAGGTGGIATVLSRQMGTTKEEENAAKHLMPSYNEGKTTAIKFTDDGKVVMAPLNYVLPHANMAGAVEKLMKRENPIPFIKSSLLGNDYGPLLTGLSEFSSNTYFGTKIPISPTRDNKLLAERFVQQAFVPGLITGTLSRALKAYKGETNQLGSSPTYSDVLLRLGGVRANTYDVLGLGYASARTAVDAVTGNQTDYTQILKQSAARTGDGQVSSLNEPAIYNSRNNAYIVGQRKIADIYQALKTAQARAPKVITDDKIIEALSSAGVPNKLIIGAIWGIEIPMKRGLEDSNTDFIKKTMEGEDRPSIKELIKIRSANDAQMYRDLMLAYADYQVGQARGVNGITKLFMGLDSKNGERAAMVHAVNQKMNVGDSLEKHLLKTGALKGEDMRQLRQLEASASQGQLLPQP